MKNKNNRKNEIIENSINLIHEKGYNGTSVKDITDSAGIPKGSFYNYFKSKEDYVVEVMKFYFKEIQKNSFSIFEEENVKPTERIKCFYKKSIEIQKDKEYKKGCLIGNLTEEMADVNIKIANIAEKLHQEVTDKLYECLKSEEIKIPDEEKKQLACFIVNSWQGALLRMKSSKDSKPLDVFYIQLKKLLKI
ncbi:MAG: TetR/AcrR family transcriptional regulator [Bacillota bacterium]|nr:TetR/AcrR family transcriptional regulator [Bacillota bacterium]